MIHYRDVEDRIIDFREPGRPDPVATGTAQTPTQDAAIEPPVQGPPDSRSEEHTSELQSLMRNSYAVFCLKKKKKKKAHITYIQHKSRQNILTKKQNRNNKEAI